MSDLLDTARAHLGSNDPLAIRRACWLARAALESAVIDLLSARGIDVTKASERGKLSCLEGAYADDRQLTSRAEYAWSRLSEACHQHAYQLSPTHVEAKQLIELVAGVAEPRST